MVALGELLAHLVAEHQHLVVRRAAVASAERGVDGNAGDAGLVELLAQLVEAGERHRRSERDAVHGATGLVLLALVERGERLEHLRLILGPVGHLIHNADGLLLLDGGRCRSRSDAPLGAQRALTLHPHHLGTEDTAGHQEDGEHAECDVLEADLTLAATLLGAPRCDGHIDRLVTDDEAARDGLHLVGGGDRAATDGGRSRSHDIHTDGSSLPSGRTAPRGGGARLPVVFHLLRADAGHGGAASRLATRDDLLARGGGTGRRDLRRVGLLVEHLVERELRVGRLAAGRLLGVDRLGGRTAHHVECHLIFGHGRLLRGDALEPDQDLMHRLGPVFAALGDHLHDQLGELRGDGLLGGARDIGRLLVDLRMHDADLVLAREGGATGERKVEHEAERVDVAAGVEGLAARLLGRHVFGRAEHDARLGQAGIVVDGLGDAEVEHLDADAAPLGVDEHDVVGLDVAVDDLALVGLAEHLTRLHGDAHHMVGRHALARAAHELPERDALDVLHRDVERALFQPA